MKTIIATSLLSVALTSSVFAADKKVDAKAKDKSSETKAEAPKADDKGPEITQKCALEFEHDGKSIGTVVVGLFGKVVPKTADNFIVLCSGNTAKVLTDEAKKIEKEDAVLKKSAKFAEHKYSKTVVHRIIPGFMVQAGDFENANGTGGSSIYGRTFADENFTLKHMGAGTLSMANAGPGTNGSQFFITVADTAWLDGHHVVFGKVIEGMDVLKKVESFGSQSGATSGKVMISNTKEVK
ncbi:MAG: peptidylprolyl isomerase [Chitinophagaceae bacterium]|nr:peptidylprolyl isomerase [Oligoflexus sp.]